MGQCGQFWLGVLHLRSAWLLLSDEEEKWGPVCNQPHLLLEERAAISDAKDLASFVENISSLLQIMRETMIPRAAKLLDLV